MSSIRLPLPHTVGSSASTRKVGKSAALLPALLALALAGSALAQAPAAPAAGQGAQPQANVNRCAVYEGFLNKRLTEVEPRLALTDAQKPLFAAFKQARLDAAAKDRALCEAAQPKPGAARPTMVEREAQLEQSLAQRLANLQAARPSLLALYDGLNPAQRTTLDQGFGAGGHWAGMHHGGGHGQRAGGAQAPAAAPAR